MVSENYFLVVKSLADRNKNRLNTERRPRGNWVAVYDLWNRRNFDEMFDLAEQLYPGFSKN